METGDGRTFKLRENLPGVNSFSLGKIWWTSYIADVQFMYVKENKKLSMTSEHYKYIPVK